MATESFKIFGIVDLEGGEKVLKGLEQIGDKAESTGERLSAIGEGLASFGVGLTFGVTLPLGIAGKEMLETALDANEMRNKFSVIFGEMTEDVREWADEYANATNQSKLDTQRLIGDIGMMGRTAGLSSVDLVDFSTKVLELAGDISAFNDVPIEEVVEGFSSAFKGSGEILDNWGIAVDATTMQLYMQQKGIQGTWAELDKLTKMNLIVQASQEQTGFMTGYAAKEADSSKGSWRGLLGDIKDLSDELGQHLIPHFDNIVDRVQKVVDWFGMLSPEMQKVILAVAAFSATLGPLIMAVGMLTFGLGALATAQWAVLGPIALVVAAIAGLTGIIIYAWNTNTKFQEAVVMAWRYLQAAGHAVFPSIKQVGRDAFDAINRSINGVIQFLTGLMNFLTGVFTLNWRRAFGGLADIVIGFKETLAGPFQWIEDRLKGSIKWIQDFLSWGDKTKNYSPPKADGGGGWGNLFGAGTKGFAEGGVFPANKPRGVIMGDAAVPEAALPLSENVLGKLGATIAQFVSPQGNGGTTIHQHNEFNGVESAGEFKRKLDQANRAIAWELQFI